MRDEYPWASDVPRVAREQEHDRRATEDEGAVVEDEPRPGSIDFDEWWFRSFVILTKT